MMTDLSRRRVLAGAAALAAAAAAGWNAPVTSASASTKQLPRQALAGTSQPTLMLGANEGRFAEVETALARPLNIRRSYGSTVADVVASSRADKAAGRASWVSFTTWPTPTALAGAISSITNLTLLTYLHEVNNGPKLDAPTFRRRHDALHNAALSNPLVKVGTILTADPFRSNSYQQWMPTRSDFVGVDGYRFWRQPGSPADPKTGTTGQSRSLQWICGDGPAYAASKGIPFAIGEFGAHPFTTDTANRPTWLTESVAWLRSIDALAACYFHSQLGESGPWLLDRFHIYTVNETDPARLTGVRDPASLAAFRAEL